MLLQLCLRRQNCFGFLFVFIWIRVFLGANNNHALSLSHQKEGKKLLKKTILLLWLQISASTKFSFISFQKYFDDFYLWYWVVAMDMELDPIVEVCYTDSDTDQFRIDVSWHFYELKIGQGKPNFVRFTT